MKDRGPLPPAWIAVGAVLLPYLGFWAYGLFDLDEGFYASVAWEMARSGDWITPRYNGAPWFEKPVLLYWVTAPFVALRPDELGARLPSVLASLATLAVLYGLGRRPLGEAAALLGALVLGTSLLFVGLGRMIMTDPWLVLALTFALLALWRSLEPGGGRWRTWAGIGVGVGILAKGPIALILFAAVAVVWAVLDPASRRSLARGWLVPALAGLVVVACWYLPAWLVDGSLFVREFLIEQNVNRFLGGDVAHRVPWSYGWAYYLPVLLLGMFPWSLGIPIAWPRRADRDEEPARRFRRFCATWAAVVVLLFTASGSKLPHYVAPALPPLALLVGAELARRARARPIWAWLPVLASPLVAAAVHLAFLGWYRATHAEVHELVRQAASMDAPLVVFRMAKRGGGAGPFGLQETDHPSIVFYRRAPVLKTDDFAEIVAARGPILVLTRAGRFSREERTFLFEQGRSLRLLSREDGRYALYAVPPPSAGAGSAR